MPDYAESEFNMNMEKIKQVFSLQRESKHRLSLRGAEERIAGLLKLKQAIIKEADTLNQALYADLGRPLQKPYSSELAEVVMDIDFASANLSRWMEPRKGTASILNVGAEIYTMFEARGTVLLMGAWNFPFSLIFSPLVAILAAGNNAMIKTNEMAPATAGLTARIIRETFSEEEVAVFEGGVDLAEKMLELPFDHIFFTGSPKVGKIIMQAAGRHLSSVTLELGGKCPGIWERSANLAATVKDVGIGKTYNCGQVCLSVDHLWAPENMMDECIKGLSAWFNKAYYANGAFSAERMGRMVDRSNFERVQGYLEDALAKGAQVVFGGGSVSKSLTIEPTILTNVPLDSMIMREEIFGPILPILPYSDIKEVTEFINSREKPLGMYLYSNNRPFIDKVLKETSSGGVTVNGWARHFAENQLPFGGVNNSGIGRYHGIYGFMELSHEKAVLIAQPGQMANLV